MLAASSLTNAFTQLGKEFEAAHPGTSVKFSFGSSSTLATQIEQGAPADVFASADQANMTKVVKAGDNSGRAGRLREEQARDRGRAGQPEAHRRHSPTSRSPVSSSCCAIPSVPCGKFADQVLANAKVSVTPKSREVNVKATLSKVELGEADAAHRVRERRQVSEGQGRPA